MLRISFELSVRFTAHCPRFSLPSAIRQFRNPDPSRMLWCIAPISSAFVLTQEYRNPLGNFTAPPRREKKIPGHFTSINAFRTEKIGVDFGLISTLFWAGSKSVCVPVNSRFYCPWFSSPTTKQGEKWAQSRKRQSPKIEFPRFNFRAVNHTLFSPRTRKMILSLIVFVWSACFIYGKVIAAFCLPSSLVRGVISKALPQSDKAFVNTALLSLQVACLLGMTWFSKGH